jgi:conjugative relaxase-like TrwC/TraI family protein
MVASISARGGAKAALSYYSHLQADDYYTGGNEPPGRWAGDGAERLSLQGPVTRTEFEAALQGRDPKTGEQLAKEGGRSREHSAGWDMTFSAPKSVSVLWALSDQTDRQQIADAHRSAVMAATSHLERTAAWARRGSGGSVREQTAGLLVAQFDHHTSRESDPQLHTHSFVFNLAPRQDGSWGAIVSRELYKAQKTAGAVYRNELANGLERLGHRVERQADGFRVAAIPHDIERAFSKRRLAIEEAARTHGYSTPKGMELATLRTRRAKHDGKIDELLKGWQAEAKSLGFELPRERQSAGERSPPGPEPSLSSSTPGRTNVPTAARPKPVAVNTAALQQKLAGVAQAVAQALRSIDQPSGMPGIKVKLRSPDHERDS